MLKKTGLLVIVAIVIIAGYVMLLKSPEDQQRTNIILITIDTLRADHLSAYGYPRLTSPFIDSLAKKGIIFNRAFSPMATTAPSHSSIFTSLYPIQHKIFKNGHRLDDSFLTMAEMLKEKEYLTAGIVSTNVHFKDGNIHQGFDFFNEPVLEKDQETHYRPAKETIDVAIKWLNGRKSTDRFFLWIHLFDPHYPVQPPMEFLDNILKQTSGKRISFIDFLMNEQYVNSDYFKGGANQMFAVISSYDGEILYVDTEIKRLFTSWQYKRFDSDDLWIITSDHGEGLGNHRWYFHGKHIYNEQLKVPLIIYFSSGSFGSTEIDKVVESVDILPTVAELVGGDLNAQIKPVQGTSLVPLFRKDHGLFPDKYAFAQRRAFDEKQRPEEIFPESDYEDGETYALQDKEYKYFYRTQGKNEFYNLRDDPYEVNNILGSGQEAEKKMRNIIINKVKKFKQSNDSQPESVDKGVIERLKSLGYLQ